MKNTVSIKRNNDFRRIYAKGKSAVSPSLALYVRNGAGKGNRLGLTVSTKVGCAVVRNRVRRRLKEAYRLHENELKTPRDIIIVARVRASRESFASLERELLGLFRRLGLLSEEQE